MIAGNLARRVLRKVLAMWECGRFGFRHPKQDVNFTIVSCERNAGNFAIKCLDSVYYQRYSSDLLRHIFIDDASEDDTFEKIRSWMDLHPGNRVEMIHRENRCGGSYNTLAGIRMASDNSIVLELNGDDWLPDSSVLSFYNKVYASQDIWMTYNSFRNNNGPPSSNARKYSRAVIEANLFRDQAGWQASHLHTFRKRLFNHVDKDIFIDPKTGTYWTCADDQALYLALLELAGRHSLHLNRITCVYNHWEASHTYYNSAESLDVAERIRKGRRYNPLMEL